MMIKIAAVRVVAVLGHKLDNLQRALLAVNIGNIDVGFPGCCRTFGVHEQTIRKHRLLWLLRNRR